MHNDNNQSFWKMVFETPTTIKTMPIKQIKFCDSLYMKILIKYPIITFVKLRIVKVPVFFTILTEVIIEFADIAAKDPDKSKLFISFITVKEPDPLAQ